MLLYLQLVPAISPSEVDVALRRMRLQIVTCEVATASVTCSGVSAHEQGSSVFECLC